MRPLLVAVLIAAGTSGCGARPRPPGTTAVIAIGTDPGHFNPAITTAAQVHAVADSLYNGLVALDRNGEPRPDLAESWEISEGGRRYLFHLARGVVWHDGEPFTSRDVAFTFREILLRYHARTRAGLEGVLESIETPDEHSVVFRFRKPYAPLLSRLDVTEAPILPAHVFAGSDVQNNSANLAPIGTGPFRLASYRRDDRIELVRNERYFKPGLPHLDRLVFRVIPDPSTQLLALENGEVDYASSLRASDAATLRHSKDFTVISTKSGPGGGNCIMTWIFNLERPALASLEVRRALALSIDRNEILDKVLFGEGEVPQAPFSSGIGWASAPGALSAYPYNPSQAAALLDAQTPRLRALDIVHFPTFVKYGEIMREQLSRVGIELKIRPLDRAATVETLFVRRDFDTGLVSYCNGVDPEIGLRRMYDSSDIAPVPFSNGAAYRNPAVDRLFGLAAVEADREKRGMLYREIQQQVAQDLPYWWLVETRGLTAYRKSFRDFAPWSGQFAERARKTSNGS
jgi:peptide/nickel transport system substrate-binding protein